MDKENCTKEPIFELRRDREMSDIHLPMSYRVKNSYWVGARITLAIWIFLLLLMWAANAKQPWPTGLVWILVIFSLFWGLLFWWSGWIFRLDLTNEGFRFRAHFGNWKMDWHQIQKVEHKIYQSKGGPRVSFWVFGDNPEKPAKLRFLMFEKGTAEGFFHTLKAKASHAKLDEKVLELLHS